MKENNFYADNIYANEWMKTICPQIKGRKMHDIWYENIITRQKSQLLITQSNRDLSRLFLCFSVVYLQGVPFYELIPSILLSQYSPMNTENLKSKY